MVSSILPGTAGANALGVDTRYTRQSPQSAAPKREDVLGDRVELTATSLSAARESVRSGLSQLHQALVAGQDAQSMLLQIQDIARSGAGQAQLDALLAGYSKRIESAAAGGAAIVTGGDVTVQAEPGSSPVTIPGVDLRLKDEPNEGDVLQVPADAKADSAALQAQVQKSLEALQSEMERLIEQARSLEAHQGFLGAAEGAASTSVRHDLDADGARLMALQVRQGLSSVRTDAIANADPQAVLALFREA